MMGIELDIPLPSISSFWTIVILQGQFTVQLQLWTDVLNVEFMDNSMALMERATTYFKHYYLSQMTP